MISENKGNETVQGTGRCFWIDTLKGIAIILVIMGHMEQGLVEDGMFDQNRYFWIWDFIYSFHMPLFFILCGITEKLFSGKLTENVYSMTIKIQKWTGMTLRSIISLYIPYLIFSYLTWIIKFFVLHDNSEITYADLLTILYKPHFIYWFLISLMLIKIVDGTMEIFGTPKYFSLFFWLLMYVLGYFIKNEIFSLVVGYGIFFCLGKVFAETVSDQTGLPKAVHWVEAVLIILLGILIPGNLSDYFPKLFMGTGMSYIIITVCRMINKNIPILNITGAFSMVPYTLHVFFLSAIRMIFRKMGNMWLSSFWLCFICGTAVTVIIFVGMIHLLKLPIFKIFLYFFYPTKNKYVRKLLQSDLKPGEYT